MAAPRDSRVDSVEPLALAAAARRKLYRIRALRAAATRHAGERHVIPADERARMRAEFRARGGVVDVLPPGDAEGSRGSQWHPKTYSERGRHVRAARPAY